MNYDPHFSLSSVAPTMFGITFAAALDNAGTRTFVWCCSLGGPKSSNESARICSYGRLVVALKAREITEDRC